MPISRHGTLEEARFRFEASLRDPAKSIALAERYASDVKVEKYESKIKRTDGVSRAMKKIRGKSELAILPSAPSQETSDRIRAVVALRFQQFSDKEIERRLSLWEGWVYDMERKYYEAFDTALTEHTKLILSEYYRNMIINKAALSRAGGVAVEALRSVAEDKSAGSRNRVDAARAILSLVNINETGKGESATGVANAMRDTVKALIDKESSGGDDYVVDADFEEEESEDAS